MTTDRLIHVGMNAYLWGEEDQRRLLTRCLGPLARQLRLQERIRSFWFSPFDARGPHVFALFTASASDDGELISHLEMEVKSFLSVHPSRSKLSSDEVLERHEQCRGKSFWSVARRPGIASNNSLVIDFLDSREYPLFLVSGAVEGESLWEAMGDRALWSIDQLTEGTTTSAAMYWPREVDRSLLSAGFSGTDYWRYHATTLLLPLAARIVKEGEEAVVASLPQGIGRRNFELFSRFWQAPLASGRPDEEVASLVELAVPYHPEDPWALLREINHTTLLQLGQPVILHIPMVLFAWWKNSTAATTR